MIREAPQIAAWMASICHSSMLFLSISSGSGHSKSRQCHSFGAVGQEGFSSSTLLPAWLTCTALVGAFAGVRSVSTVLVK